MPWFQPILIRSSVRSGAAELTDCTMRAATASENIVRLHDELRNARVDAEEILAALRGNSAVTMTRLILVMHSLALFVDSLKCGTSLMARRSDLVPVRVGLHPGDR